jgi:hypothetical protein
MTRWLDKAILCLVGLTFMGMMAYGARDQVFTGANDFLPLYNGTQLLGTPHLYSAEHNYALIHEHAGGFNLSLRYTRPPYYAALLWPLGQLPYLYAYLLWTLIGFCALAAFALLWRIPSPADALVLTCFSLPAFQSLMNGQDTPLLLLWIALAVLFERKGRLFAAGFVLALCASKFHLFTLLPLVFVGQRRWPMLKGFAAGAACLVALSFAVAGPNWPLEYYHTLTDNRVHPDVFRMPNLHGLLSGLPAAGLLQVVAGAAVVVATWRVVQHSSFLYGLATALIGSLLLSYHSYLSDCALLLPAATVVYAETRIPWLRLLGALLLTPFLYFLLIAERPATYFAQLVIAAFFAGTVWHAFRHARPQEAQPSPPLVRRAAAS